MKSIRQRWPGMSLKATEALRNTWKDYQRHSELLRRIDMQRYAQWSTHRCFPCALCELPWDKVVYCRLSCSSLRSTGLSNNPHHKKEMKYDGHHSHNWTTWILLMIWLSCPTPNNRCKKTPILCLCKPADSITRQALTWNPEGGRKRGRLRSTWHYDLEADVKETGDSWRDCLRAWVPGWVM